MLRELSLPKPYGIAVRADMKNYPGRIVSKAIGHRTGTSRSPHLPERVRNTKSQSSPLNVYFLLSGSFNPRFYSFTSATVRIPVHTSLKCGSEPIGCVTIQFWDQRVAASLRYRNRAEITFLCAGTDSYRVRFWCRCKSYPIFVPWFLCFCHSTDYIYWKYRVFSLTWSAYMQIYWNKRKRLHKKRVQLPQDWFGTPTWPPRIQNTEYRTRIQEKKKNNIF